MIVMDVSLAYWTFQTCQMKHSLLMRIFMIDICAMFDKVMCDIFIIWMDKVVLLKNIYTKHWIIRWNFYDLLFWTANCRSDNPKLLALFTFSALISPPRALIFPKWLRHFSLKIIFQCSNMRWGSTHFIFLRRYQIRLRQKDG